MLERDAIKSKVNEIVNHYAPIAEPEMDRPLTLRPYHMDARELTAVFLDMEREFGVNLNKLFDEPIDFSIDSLANAVSLQL